MPSRHLSGADARVLAQVFDPESAAKKVEVLVDHHLPIDCHLSDIELLKDLQRREQEAIAIVEQAEKSQLSSHDREAAYSRSLRIFDQLIAEQPKYASALNNRAELRRMRFGDRNTLCQMSADFDAVRGEAALMRVADLRAAAALASPKRSQDAVSPIQGRLLRQIYTQLGALYLAASKDMDCHEVMHIATPDFVGWSRDRFEEEASKLFHLGGLYGSELGKALAIHTNPHAKMCGSIVKEAMRIETAGLLA